MDSTMTNKNPACPSCGRVCAPGATWKGANYCRGLILLNFIEDQPGLTGWELSEKTGIPYTDATKGLAKLREFRAVRTESEERETGGFRYRYRPIDDFQAHAAFVEAVRRVEGLQ